MHRYLKPAAGFFICLFLFALPSKGQDEKKSPNKHRDMRLTFNEEGKLLDGYLPRYNPGVNKKDDCDKYKLTIRVLLPVDYFKAEKEKMDAKAKALYAALNDPDKKSTLARILSGCKDKKDTIDYYDKLKKKFATGKQMEQWEKGDSTLMPAELTDYAKFIEAFNNYKESNDKKTQAAGLKMYMKFAPFRLKVKGVELNTDCMEFVPVSSEDDCKCLERNKKYIALQFTVPAGFLTREVALDSFQLIRKYYMKEKTVDWYNKMLKEHKKSLKALQLLDKKIKDSAFKFNVFIKAIDSLQLLQLNCYDTVKLRILESQAGKLLCDYKDKLKAEFGEYNCKDSCSNLLLCFTDLKVWLAKLAWLNGDEVRLNPFPFTMNKVVVNKQDDEKVDFEKKKRVKKEAEISIKFWETGIRHLEDSLLLMQGNAEWVKTAKMTLDSLLRLRDTAIVAFNEEVPDEPGDLLVNNIQSAKGFLTVSQVNYKGWIVPYKSSESNKAYQPDKMWLRNYYADQMPAPLRQKLHYTYPENENVTLLLHNMGAGTASSLTESITPFADSALFTMLAGEFISQAASLYSSLNTIAPIVKSLVGAKERVKADPVVQTKIETLTKVIGGAQPFNTFKNNDLQNILKNNQNKNIGAIIKDKNNKILDFIGYQKFNTGEWLDQGMDYSNTKIVFVTMEEKSFTKPGDDSPAYDSAIIDYGTKKPVEMLRVETRYSSGIVKVYTLIDKYEKQLRLILDTSGQTVRIDSCFSERDTCYLNYLNALNQLNKAPVFIDEALEIRNDTTPIYRTDKYPLRDSIAPYKNEYTLKSFLKKGEELVLQYVIDNSFIRTGKFRYLQTAAGIAYTPNGGSITSVDTTNGGFKISRDEDRFRLIGGLRWYPAGLYNLKNPQSIVRERRWVHRLSLMAAVGVPKPLENIYLGGGFDLVPGLNICAGVHFQQQNKFTIVNNQVLDKSVSYRGKAFYSLTVDPALLINAITTLFK